MHAPGNMTSVLCLEFLLFLLSRLAYSEEPEPLFRPQGGNIEMGYCFGADYIAVYRSAPGGDQLLGNSSELVTPPPDLQGRIQVTKQQHLLGLQIGNLTHVDSGIYKRECWENRTLASHVTQELFVCDEELESQEIIVNDLDTRTELLCSTSTGTKGTSVRWYREIYPTYKLTLFLDSNVSLDPLVEELQSVGIVEVKDEGAVLVLDNHLLKNNQHFYCLKIKGKKCLSFKNIYLPDRSENREIFASEGDRVVLSCPSDGFKQQWETPQGVINASMTKGSMHLSGDKGFSLVIPSVSDEHSGEFSCISSSLEIIYSLVLCPMKDPSLERRENFVEGGNILLECDFDQMANSVHWYRRQSLLEDELIHDSSDGGADIPEDLRDRLIVSEHGSSLNISNMRMEDEGVYYCVVIGDHEFLLDEDFYDDYNDTGDAESDYQENWTQPQRCMSKQETTLTWTNEDPPHDFSGFLYVIVGALVLMVVVVGVIVTVIAVRRKRRRKRPSHCELRATEKDDDHSRIKMLNDHQP